jgi:hypothetical protein
MDERKARTDEEGGAWGCAHLVGGARTLGGGAYTWEGAHAYE